MMWIDVRCDSTLRMGSCNRLLFRRDPETQGRIEAKCPKCSQVKEIRLAAVYNLTT